MHLFTKKNFVYHTQIKSSCLMFSCLYFLCSSSGEEEKSKYTTALIMTKCELVKSNQLCKPVNYESKCNRTVKDWCLWFSCALWHI